MGKSEFQEELETLLNKHSMENASDTPDFLLARFLEDVLVAYNSAMYEREHWHGRKMNWEKNYNL